MARTETFLDERRETLRQQTNPRVNGIDYIEVNQAAAQIELHLVHVAPGMGLANVPNPVAILTPAQIVISGGDRITGITATKVEEHPANPRCLLVSLSRIGDFSIYRLQLNHSGFDPMLGVINFGFQLNCRGDFDCQTPEEPAAAYPTLVQNHLAKDFDSFRRVMLDRMAQLVPDWADRQIADIGVTLVEIMALYGDHLSYAQDSAATEAYIGTARRRASVRRHAQLLGYNAQDGASARVFVQVQMSGDGIFSRENLTFLTRSTAVDVPVLDIGALDKDSLLAAGVQVYEPANLLRPGNSALGEPDWMPRPIRLQASQNRLTPYDWSDARAILPKGATSAWFLRPAAPFDMAAGDFLSLELLRDPVTLNLADADPALRQIVCLSAAPEFEQDQLVEGAPVDLVKLTWHTDDALEFDLPIGTLASVTDGGPALMAVACGNIVLTDHGMTLRHAEYLGAPKPDDDPEAKASIAALSELDRPLRFVPTLRRRDISVTQSFAHAPGSARALIDSRGDTTKAISLSDTTALPDWIALPTLLFSRPDDRAFVAETEADGTTTLRFGAQGEGGASPHPANPLTAHYRVGIGKSGNIGAGSIAHIALNGVASGPISARNPLPATGGRDRETVPEIRQRALAGIDENRRAVTRDDYARLAQLHPKVQKAQVRSVGHGSWDTFFVAIDPVGAVTVNAQLLKDVRDYLEPFRLMGQDLEVEAPKLAALDVTLAVCVCPDFHETEVRRAVEDRLSARMLPDGSLGFFHPDLFSFGAPVYISRLIAAVKLIPGVVDVRVDQFRKWRSADTMALQNGVLQVDPAEIPVLMNDPNHPERGVLRVKTWGLHD